MTYDDFMRLQREDLIELNLPIGLRNKLMSAIAARKVINKPKENTNKAQEGLKVMELMMNSMV